MVVYQVEDYDVWWRFYNDDTANRRTHGSKESFINRNNEYANEIILFYQWDTMDNARKFFDSEDEKNKMKDAGVIGEPIIVYLNEIERAIA